MTAESITDTAARPGAGQDLLIDRLMPVYDVRQVAR